MSECYGWEMLGMTSPNQEKTKENVIIKLIHFTLTKCGFLCHGLDQTDQGIAGSEVLPQGWDLHDGNCSFKYSRETINYNLRTARTGKNIVVNFLEENGMQMSCTLIDVENTVASTQGTLPEVIPTYKTIINQIKSQLIEPFNKGKVQNAETQTSLEQPASPMMRQEDPPRGFRHSEWDPVASRPPMNVGRGDLDPLGGFGHGMLFNPFGEGRRILRDPSQGQGGTFMPRGAIPPGARFDPIGPFGPLGGPRAGPNPDLEQPPGYDDMFM